MAHPFDLVKASPGPIGARLLRAAAVALLASVCACGDPAAPQLAEGRAFPLSMLDGVVNADGVRPALHGKIVVLNIWATWCVPCRKEMPSLERLSRALDGQRYAVVGLSIDDDVLLAAEFLTQNAITFANFFDPNGKISGQLGVRVYPETFVIAQDGTLARRMTGMRDWSDPAVLALLDEIGRAPRGKHVSD